MTRKESIDRHNELLKEHGIYCLPNKDYMPDGMLYYADLGCKHFLFSINSHDPIAIVPILEEALTAKYTMINSPNAQFHGLVVVNPYVFGIVKSKTHMHISGCSEYEIHVCANDEETELLTSLGVTVCLNDYYTIKLDDRWIDE